MNHTFEFLARFQDCIKSQQSIEFNPNIAISPMVQEWLRFHRLSPFFSMARTPSTEIEVQIKNALLIERQQLAFQEMQRIKTSFIDAGITEPIFLKGPLLAKRYYRDAHLRPFSDIDVLIPMNDRETAKNLLKENYLLGECNEFKEVWEGGSFPIEIHYGLHTEVLEKPLRTKVDAFEFSHLSIRDELNFLAYHAFIQHRFQHLIWCLDIVLILKQEQLSITDISGVRSYQNAIYLFQDLTRDPMTQFDPKSRQFISWICAGSLENQPWRIFRFRSWLLNGMNEFLSYRIRKNFRSTAYSSPQV